MCQAVQVPRDAQIMEFWAFQDQTKTDSSSCGMPVSEYALTEAYLCQQHTLCYMYVPCKCVCQAVQVPRDAQLMEFWAFQDQTKTDSSLCGMPVSEYALTKA